MQKKRGNFSQCEVIAKKIIYLWVEMLLNVRKQ